MPRANVSYSRRASSAAIPSDGLLNYQRLQRLQVKDTVYRDYRTFHSAITFVDFPLAFLEAFEIIHDSAQFVINRTRTTI